MRMASNRGTIDPKGSPNPAGRTQQFGDGYLTWSVTSRSLMANTVG
ncbi:hypothetical protein EV132_10830 [Rhizobium sullae]|uniref:Uncharacterized protein n=1 Tax=Rhizobium sullae TaxID=50338 RepID=A0A4R3Q2M9_RHISU|nr:hypothetical protein EV132_10830 [Rhizobium sullae]